jgi:SAM-dependent MidA family methyltransferase
MPDNPRAAKRETPRLNAVLEARAHENGGALPWENWMAAALYEPGLGYYSSRARQPGRGGDFSTAATIGEALGRAIAAWAHRRARELRLKGPLHLLEIGAGGGQLAETILRHLGWARRWRWNYAIVEVSPTLRQTQEERLTGRGVRWFDDPAAAMQALGGRALVISNELVDAFPCLALKREAPREGGTGWLELWLRPAPELEGGWEMVWLPAGRHTLGRAAAGSLLQGKAPLAEGQVVEVHAAYYEWLHEWLPGLIQGAHLTIDYGAEAAQLYHRRPRGTLRAYFQHLPMHGQELFARPGHQDLTADVNFTDLRAWGEHLGLRTASLLSQRDFILQNAPKVAAQLPAYGDQMVMNPLGAGEAFLVLEQVRDA